LLVAAVLVGGLALSRHAPAPAGAQEADNSKLAGKARAVLAKYCARCHDNGKRAGGFGYALDVKKMIAKRMVVPGKLDDGFIVRVTATEDAEKMPPPEAKERPSAAEIDDLKAWIKAGAPAFPAAAPVVAKARPYFSELDAYRAMVDFLRKHHDQARYKRFLTLTHLHNDPAVSDKTLRLYHAGVSKLLNSLSWRRDLVLPTLIDTHGAVLAFDLRDLDWDLGDQWYKLVAREGKHPGYVYGLTHERYPEDRELNLLAAEAYKRSGTRLPAVRADWFLAAAALPPLYHELLNLPETAGEIEKRLGVHVAQNFRRDYLVRIALEVSGVAVKANRLLERHKALYGAYWKSYDFGSSAGRANLRQFPLGPLNLFPKGKHPYEAAAFQHDGGEIIWNLPNGLQAYLLVDKNDRRLDKAPPIVRDEKETAGDGTTIVNGLSCMACHKHGMIDKDVRDVVRAENALEGDEKEKVRRLYPEQREADRWLQTDRELFMRSLERAIGPYVRLGDDEKRPLEQFAEPVSALASPYLKSNVTLAQAARELGIKDPLVLKVAIENNPVLRNTLGLRGLAAGGTVKREFWESLGRDGYSIFQSAAAELKRGTARKERR
jgi:serine/threonine-protein kinase